MLDIVEPFAATVAKNGKPPRKRLEMLRLVGQPLLVQNRVAGRVAVEEKPDVLWDRPDLERNAAECCSESSILLSKRLVR